MTSWGKLFVDKSKAVGEVAGVEAGKIEVFVYPEYYPRVRVGSVLAIDSEGSKPVGIVIKLAHTARHAGIVPLRKTRQEIRNAYPDIERYYRYVSTIAYTSNITSGNIVHVRTSMPRLHDLVYIIGSNDLLDAFFKPDGEWNFDFLRYYIAEGASILEIREFFYTYKEYFQDYRDDKEEVISKLVRVLLRSGVSNVALYIEEIINMLGWG